MDFNLADLAVVRQLLIQFDTVDFHSFLDIVLLQSVSKCIVKIRIDKSHELVVLQYDQ